MFMGEVDLNEELKYSTFSRQSLKWWEIFFFHLMNNTAMINSYIIYKALVSTKSSTKTKGVTQTDFCTNVIKAVIAGAGNEL